MAHKTKHIITTGIICLCSIILFIVATITQTNAGTDSQSLPPNHSSNNTKTFLENIRTISEKFLNVPYRLDPLGEGTSSASHSPFHKDSDPLYRTDVFDCLTFVETVIANAMVSSNIVTNDLDIVSTISKIRYRDGKVAFENRLHFQYPDWVNNNKNILAEASTDIAKSAHANTATSTINLCRSQWFKHSHNIDLPKNVGECEPVKLTYIPFDEIENNLSYFEKTITTPLVFMTVISDKSLQQKIGTDYNVSHTGFLMPHSSGKLYLRHASSVSGKVVDSEFLPYIKTLHKNKKYLGFALFKFTV